MKHSTSRSIAPLLISALAITFSPVAYSKTFSDNERAYIMDSLKVYDTSLRDLSTEKNDTIFSIATPDQEQYTCPEFGSEKFTLPPLDKNQYDISEEKANYIEDMLAYHYAQVVNNIDNQDIAIFHNISSLLPTKTLPCTDEIKEVSRSVEASDYFKNSDDLFNAKKASLFESLVMKINMETLYHYSTEDYDLFNNLATKNLYQ